MNRYKLSVLAIVIAIVTSVNRSVAGEKTWTTTLSTDFVSQYVGFGNGAVFFDKPMFQTDLFVSHRSGFHADVWWGTGLNNDLTGSGFDDEIDYNLGFASAVPFTNGKLLFDLGVGYWDLFDLITSTRNDLLHPYVELSYPIIVSGSVKLTPFAKFDGYNLPFETDFEEGTITSAGCKYRIDLGGKFALTGLTSFGYDDGGFGFQRGVIWKDYINLEWAISDKLIWRVAEVQLYVPLGVTDREPQRVFGTGVTFAF